MTAVRYTFNVSTGAPAAASPGAGCAAVLPLATSTVPRAQDGTPNDPARWRLGRGSPPVGAYPDRVARRDLTAAPGTPSTPDRAGRRTPPVWPTSDEPRGDDRPTEQLFAVPPAAPAAPVEGPLGLGGGSVPADAQRTESAPLAAKVHPGLTGLPPGGWLWSWLGHGAERLLVGERLSGGVLLALFVAEDGGAAAHWCTVAAEPSAGRVVRGPLPTVVRAIAEDAP